MKVISVVNQKGGVGKTTSTVNLASAFSKDGKKTLMIDLDPQGNATTGLGVEKIDLKSSIYNVLIEDEDINNHILKDIRGNLDLLPAKIDLAGAEVELVGKMSRESRLKNRLEKLDADYDLVIIDCPPSLGLLTINALTASDYVIVPIQCEFYALEGVAQLLNTVNLVKQELNSKLEIAAILLTMFDKRINLSEEVANEVRDYFEEKVLKTVIPRNIKLTEAPSYGKTIDEYALNSAGAIAYSLAAKEVMDSGII